MSELSSYSATLGLRRRGGISTIVCRSCGAELGDASSNWKEGALLREQPLNAIGGPYRTAGPQVMLRQFFCGSCACLLDTETALPGEPFLQDRVEG